MISSLCLLLKHGKLYCANPRSLQSSELKAATQETYPGILVSSKRHSKQNLFQDDGHPPYILVHAEGFYFLWLIKFIGLQ